MDLFHRRLRLSSLQKNNNKFEVSCEQFLALFTIFVFTLVFRNGRMGRLE